MDLTIDEELRLKMIIRSHDKEQASQELSKEIESKEKLMLESISEDYLNIISKCTDLEKIKQILPRIVNLNNELSMSIRDATMQHISVMNEIGENDQIKSRLDSVISELKEILRFMEIASQCEEVDENVREDPLYYYNLTKNVLFMKEKLYLFQKYVFFTNVNQIYTGIKGKLTELMMKDIDLWMRKVCNDIGNVGSQVNKILRGSINESCIFDALGSLRQFVITKKFLSVLYGSRKTGIDSVVVEKINTTRKEFIEGILKGDDPVMIPIITGFILWSHYLIQLDANFKTHNKFIFNLLSRNEMLFRSNNFAQIRETLISLRMLVVYLNLDFEDLDRTVSSVAINYFENQGPKDADLDKCDMETFRSSMVTFIDECNGFVSNISQFSNELDELLAKRIDSHLCLLLEKNQDDVNMFLEAQSTAKHVLNYAIERNSFYRNIEFRCPVKLGKMNRAFVDDIVKDNKSKIEELFKGVVGNDDFSINLLQIFSRIKELRFPDEFSMEIKKRLVCHVRDRFLEMLRNRKDMSVPDRKILVGHACSFYGYLKKNEPSLCGLLDPVIELCKEDYNNKD